MRLETTALCSLFLLAACDGGPDAGPASGINRQVRSLCDAGKAYLLSEMKLTCSDLPPTPETKDPQFWGETLPCASEITWANGDKELREHTYDSLPTDDLAFYGASGNMLAYDFSDFFGEQPVEVSYLYGGGRLNGVTVETTERTARYEYQYDGDRRVSEDFVEGDGDKIVHYMYAYDDDGRLVAEGLPTPEGTLAPVALADVAKDENGRRPTVPAITEFGDGPVASAANRTYVYDANGNVSTIISAWAPGLAYRVVDLTYEGGRLTEWTLEDSELGDFALAAQTRRYLYDCSN